jgi:hypothetical protein
MFEDCHLRLGRHPFTSASPLTVSLLSSLYALPHHDEQPLRLVLEATATNLPWSESLAVAPEATTAAVGAMLRAVMLATPDLEPGSIPTHALPAGARARVHLEALRDLWAANPTIVPADLRALKDFLACTATDALQPIAVVRPCTDGALTLLERVVLTRLDNHHGALAADDTDVQRLVTARWTAQAPTARMLGHVQRNLLDTGAVPMPADDSLAVLSVRDSLTECEAAAAIIQRWLADDETLRASDIGVIVPGGGSHEHHLGEVFAKTGLVASALPAVAARRNIGAEAVLHFVQCRRRPAPAMALASLYCSPVLCWPPKIGNGLAHGVMQGKFTPAFAEALEGNTAALLQLIRAPASSTNRQLREQLRRLRRFLTADDALRPDVLEARVQIARVIGILQEAPDHVEPDWERAIAFAAAYSEIPAERGPAYLGGIAVMLAHEAPTRCFRKLLILGFNDGAYPVPPSGNPFFLDSEMALIADKTGLVLPSQAHQLDAALDLFRRQLRSASEQAILLISERNSVGDALTPSSSLALFARLVEGIGKPDELPVSMARSENTIWDRLIAWQSRPAFAPAVAPDIPVHFDLGCDLLAVRKKADGSAAAQSPSRLEKLLVSPLAWLLGELGATHVSWQPERLDVMLRGSLAHEVFELLFVPGTEHPDDAAIDLAVPELLADRIRAIAPFLQSGAWLVERNALEAEIIKAARHWSLALTALGAEIIGNEFWLSGALSGHPVHGKADCLLRLPDGQLVMVDYKKSSSGARSKRLTNGWDLQVELYRQMNVRIDERSSDDEKRIAAALQTGNRAPGVAYHTLNDGRILVNGVDGIAGEHVDVIDGAIAANALDLINTRMVALRSGRIDTNSSADLAFFKHKASLGTYPLEDSPLIGAFTRDHALPSFSMEDIAE